MEASSSLTRSKKPLRSEGREKNPPPSSAALYHFPEKGKRRKFREKENTGRPCEERPFRAVQPVGKQRISTRCRREGEKVSVCPLGALFRLRRRCLFFSFFSPHNGQPLPESVVERNAQPKNGHGDAVPKFLFCFQIFLAFHAAFVPSILRLIPMGAAAFEALGPIGNLAYYMPVSR